MTDPTAEAAYRSLRSQTTGDLRFDENLRPIKYVIAPADGRLIAPVMVAMIRAFDCVLFVPRCEEGAMEVQITLEQFDEHGEHGALADRWRIHHGEPPDVNWALFDIDAVRHEGLVIDGLALQRPNPLAEAEPEICRHMNLDHRDALKALCLHRAKIDVEEPVMVAIDPLGIDVRGRFDVIRVNAVEPMETRDDARRVLTAMAEESLEAVANGLPADE